MRWSKILRSRLPLRPLFRRWILQTQLQQPAVRAEQQLLRGGGSSRGRGANAPPRQWVPVFAAPLDRAIAPQLQVPAVNPPQTLLPPASTENSSRPGFGTEGQETIVKTNYLLASVDERVLHHYDVAISPAVTSKNICRMIMNQLVEIFHDSYLGKRVLAYDGRKNIYTAGPLPFISKKFGVMFDVEESGFEREFIVTIRCVSKVHHHRELGNPNEIIQFLNVVLREKASNSHRAVGRSFFHLDFGKEELGNGLDYWNGFYQSLGTTQIGLSHNIDMTATAFFEPILVTEFVSKYLNMTDLNRPLSDQDHIKLNSALKGVKAETNHLGFIRHYKISGVSTVATERLMFSEVKSGQPVLQYRHLLAVQTDSRTRPVYLPMELCTIVEGQRYSKKLNHRQATHLLQATGKRPKQREKVIKEMVEQNDYNRDELVHTEFGIQVIPELMSIKARVLPPPELKYHDSGTVKQVQTYVGQWNMMDKKMVNGGKVEFWTCINFSRHNMYVVEDFCKELINMCRAKGMEFDQVPLVTLRSLDLSVPVDGSRIEKSLIDIHLETLNKGKRLQLLLIILPNVTSFYGLIKRVCETELGIVSQCCQPQKVSMFNNQYLESLSLKINVKVGGRNTVLKKTISSVSDSVTIIFGATVKHPQSGDDSSPSIAAVVASMDWPEFTNYRALVSTQAPREEIIQDLDTSHQIPPDGFFIRGGLIREQLTEFEKKTGKLPQRIIFYRNGVSRGQFNKVHRCEIKAIQQACGSFRAAYKPKITFVVVQKRHHTRLFPADYEDRNTSDKSGNILPGTVVDTKICHPREFDFYLCSHSGIQGTSRPAHYHVLLDENTFGADELQILTNSLCYTYARCTRSVSIVPPVYYARLAASRARYYIEESIFGKWINCCGPQ